MNNEKFGCIELLWLKYRKGELKKSEILQNWLPYDKEFGSRKLFKLKYRRGDQIIQTFSKIGSPQKKGAPSLICRNFRTFRKVVLIHAEMTEI